MLLTTCYLLGEECNPSSRFASGKCSICSTLSSVSSGEHLACISFEKSPKVRTDVQAVLPQCFTLHDDFRQCNRPSSPSLTRAQGSPRQKCKLANIRVVLSAWHKRNECEAFVRTVYRTSSSPLLPSPAPTHFLMLSSILSLAALATGALAYTVHQVSVGGLKADGTPNLAFWPNNFKADVGDTVIFTL